MRNILCLYGLPASGKTTQAEKLTQEFGFGQFGMGDRLRAEIETGSELGQRIQSFVNQGTLITDDLMEEVIKNTETLKNENGVAFDGFPRIISQAEMLDRVIAEMDLNLVGFFYLKVSPETAMNRIKARAEITHRKDDEDPEAIKNRFGVFAKESIPLLEYYKNKGVLVEIDGEKSIEEVFEKIKKHL